MDKILFYNSDDKLWHLNLWTWITCQVNFFNRFQKSKEVQLFGTLTTLNNFSFKFYLAFIEPIFDCVLFNIIALITNQVRFPVRIFFCS